MNGIHSDDRRRYLVGMAIDPASPEALEPRRFAVRLPRPLWFGFATATLVVIAVGLQVGIPLYRQQVAVRDVERAGGTVFMRPRGPRWRRHWIGEERMRRLDCVISVDLHAKKATDRTLAHVGWLTELEYLGLGSTPVTDAGLSHVQTLSKLAHLNIDDTLTTDAGLSHLNGLVSLKVLNLDDTQISDAGLSHLKKLTHLQSLYLKNTQVTDDGLEHLTALIELEHLSLGNTRVTDAGLPSFEGHTKLKTLFLENTQVTEAGIATLKRAVPGLDVRK